MRSGCRAPRLDASGADKARTPAGRPLTSGAADRRLTRQARRSGAAQCRKASGRRLAPAGQAARDDDVRAAAAGGGGASPMTSIGFAMGLSEIPSCKTRTICSTVSPGVPVASGVRLLEKMTAGTGGQGERPRPRGDERRRTARRSGHRRRRPPGARPPPRSAERARGLTLRLHRPALTPRAVRLARGGRRRGQGGRRRRARGDAGPGGERRERRRPIVFAEVF
jgi:hypothetical protein